MRDSKLVVLIAPPYSQTETVAVSDQYPPVGLYYLAAVLRSNGYTVRLLDGPAHGNSMPWLFRQLASLEKEPLAVGMLVYSQTALVARRTARLVRLQFPGTTIIQGGPHPTVCYEEALSCPDVDIVARGEGEATVIELMESLRHPAFPLQRVRGIAFRDSSGAVVRTPERPPIRALDQLPVPAYQMSEDKYDQNYFYLMSSRGCPGNCVFCAARSFFGAAQRTHSPEWLFSVLYAYHRRHPFGRFSMLDDTFTVNRARVHRFCDLLAGWDTKVSWTARSRVDVIREDLVRDLARAGCRSLHIGVESGDERVLKTLGKNITLQQVKDAVRLLLEHDMYVAASFVLGHPADSVETLEKTVLLTQALAQVVDTASGPSTPYPGTPLHVRAQELGLRIHVHDWTLYNLSNPIYDTERFTMDHLRQAGILSFAAKFSRQPAELLGCSQHEGVRAELADWIEQLERLPGAIRYRRAHGMEPPAVAEDNSHAPAAAVN